MRSNIIQTLIIAFVLIAGWSLFTIYQDLSRRSNGNFSGEIILSGGSEYLPVTPTDNKLAQKSFPMYKVPAGLKSKNSGNQSAYAGKGSSLFSNPGFGVSDTNLNSGANLYADGSTSQGYSAGSGRRNNNNSQGTSSSFTVAPFSKRIKFQQERNLAMNSNTTEATSDLFSDGTRYKVLGGGSGDALEGGGGTENTESFNDSQVEDLPVGDGLTFLLILTMIYLLVQTFRKSNHQKTVIKK